MKNSYRFFSNTDCEYFPCHKTDDTENFSCMFCYCPLYHMAECPGTPEMLPNGIKDCTNCTLPHKNYDAVMAKVKETIIGMKTVTVVPCKICKYFQKDIWGEVDGMPLIVAHEICTFWGNGCKTNPEGYCFAGELKKGINHEHNESKRHQAGEFKRSNLWCARYGKNHAAGNIAGKNADN